MHTGALQTHADVGSQLVSQYSMDFFLLPHSVQTRILFFTTRLVRSLVSPSTHIMLKILNTSSRTTYTNTTFVGTKGSIVLEGTSLTQMRQPKFPARD